MIIMGNTIAINGIYQHFKGGKYKVLDIATNSETMATMVVYKALYGDEKVWVRPLEMWNEIVEYNGIKRSRFKLLSEKEQIKISLEVIADKLEETTDCWEQYFNIKTGEFEALSDGTYIETDLELAENIESSDDYIRLPNQYDINEYNIMEQFAESLDNITQINILYNILKGKKPYRKFKDQINYLGLAEQYYSFRHSKYIEIAKEWCENNNILYTH